jgi:hypothetical protein
LTNGWLGLKNREPAGWLMLREKAYTIRRSAKIVAAVPGSNPFGVRSQALTFFLPYMHWPSPINPLIPRRFGGQCDVLNSTFAVEQKYPSNLAAYW